MKDQGSMIWDSETECSAKDAYMYSMNKCKTFSNLATKINAITFYECWCSTVLWKLVLVILLFAGNISKYLSLVNISKYLL